REAVKLTQQPGISCSQVALEIGVAEGVTVSSLHWDCLEKSLLKQWVTHGRYSTLGCNTGFVTAHDSACSSWKVPGSAFALGR
ncbi:hypothetical protein, partial [Thalassolituus marinus]|uniref:hypothetical protein n=1 Tax=Thalassolituus marinus TaxID=671053 RepID=UPI001CE2481F